MQGAAEQERYEKFLTSKQPQVCLKIAMSDFFDVQTPNVHRQVYEKYLRGRIRPMVEKLIERDDAETIEHVEKMGWLTAPLVDQFIRTAAEQKKMSALIELLTIKQERYGFPRRTFEL